MFKDLVFMVKNVFFYTAPGKNNPVMRVWTPTIKEVSVGSMRRTAAAVDGTIFCPCHIIGQQWVICNTVGECLCRDYLEIIVSTECLKW